MCYMNAISVLVQKSLQRLGFFKRRSKVKVKITASKLLVPAQGLSIYVL